MDKTNLFNKDLDKTIDYQLMCKDTVLGTFRVTNNVVVDVEENEVNSYLLPKQLIFFNPFSLSNWLRSRRFDTTRSNARLILKLMKIGAASDIAPVLFNKALSLTDCYWVRELTDLSSYEEVSLYLRDTIDSIATTSLSGVLHELPRVENPELTNIGSFNKAWRKVDGEWWLFKTGTDLNNYAEMFTYYLGKSLGMNMAEYRIIDGFVCTKNFTDESIMLEHYASLMYMFQERDYDDEITLSNLEILGLDEEYCDILLLDSIVCNPDRHEFNIGVLRDSISGEVISMAPNFDNNLALGSAIHNMKPSDFLLKCYLSSIGIKPHQQKYIDALSMDLINSIDKQVKVELNIELNTINVLEHMKSTIKYLK